MKRLEVRVYGILKDSFTPRRSIELAPSASLEDLRLGLAEESEKATQTLYSCRAAVNGAFVDWGHVAANGDVIDIMPPSSGG